MPVLEVIDGFVRVPELEYQKLDHKLKSVQNLHILLHEKDLANKNLARRCQNTWSYLVSTHALLAKRTEKINSLIDTIRDKTCSNCGRALYAETDTCLQTFQSIASLPDSPFGENDENVFQNPISTKTSTKEKTEPAGDLEQDCVHESPRIRTQYEIRNVGVTDDKMAHVASAGVVRGLPSMGDSGMATWMSERGDFKKVTSYGDPDSLPTELKDSLYMPMGVSERYFNTVVRELSKTKQWLNEVLRKNKTNIDSFLDAKKVQNQLDEMRKEFVRCSEELEKTREENCNLKSFLSGILRKQDVSPHKTRDSCGLKTDRLEDEREDGVAGVDSGTTEKEVSTDDAPVKGSKVKDEEKALRDRETFDDGTDTPHNAFSRSNESAYDIEGKGDNTETTADDGPDVKIYGHACKQKKLREGSECEKREMQKYAYCSTEAANQLATQHEDISPEILREDTSLQDNETKQNHDEKLKDLQERCLEQEAITSHVLTELDQAKEECQYLKIQKEMFASNYHELLKTVEEIEKQSTQILKKENDELKFQVHDLRGKMKRKVEEEEIVTSLINSVQEDLDQEKQRNITLEAELERTKTQVAKQEGNKANLIEMYSDLRNKMNQVLYENAQLQSFKTNYLNLSGHNEPLHRSYQSNFFEKQIAGEPGSLPTRTDFSQVRTTGNDHQQAPRKMQSDHTVKGQEEPRCKTATAIENTSAKSTFGSKEPLENDAVFEYTPFSPQRTTCSSNSILQCERCFMEFEKMEKFISHRQKCLD